MTLSGRILRYFLEVLAIGSVLLIPAGCDPATLTLPSEVAGDGADAADDGAPDVDGDADGGPGIAGEPEDEDDGSIPVDDDAEDDGDSAADDADAPDDSAGEPPADDGDDDPPADDGADDNPPPDDSGDDDPPPDDGGDDPPPDDSGDDDPPPDDGGGDDPPDDSEPEGPSNAYCDPVADWADEWRTFEEEVLTLVNERRAAGATCGSYGAFAPAGPLTFELTLRCAARAHSMDMGERDFFSHTNPDGDGPGERLAMAGYSGWGWGENIAWGYASPAAVVSGWMSSPGHCANIMRPQWTIIGVGYYQGNIWTQTFGAE